MLRKTGFRSFSEIPLPLLTEKRGKRLLLVFVPKANHS